MQGIIFNLLGERVSELWGEEYWENLVKGAPGLENPVFVGPKSYPDEAFLSILNRICTDKAMPTSALLKDFGRWAFPRLAHAYPVFLEGYVAAKDFLKTVGSVIHTEVRKLYDDAYLPRIEFEDPAPETLLIIYDSRRRLCALAEGLILGVGDLFKEELTVMQEACIHQGAPACRIRVDFRAKR